VREPDESANVAVLGPAVEQSGGKRSPSGILGARGCRGVADERWKLLARDVQRRCVEDGPESSELPARER
jgi:hypothetical protein